MAHWSSANFLDLTSGHIDIQFVRYEIRPRIVILVEEGTWGFESQTQHFSGDWRPAEQVRTSVQIRADVWNQVTIDI